MGATGTTADPVVREGPPDLRRYLRVIRRDGWLIGLVTGLALVAATAVTILQTPMYRASMNIVVGQGGGIFQPQFGASVQPFVQTMASLFTSDVTASTTITDLGLHTTPTQLLGQTQVTTTPDSSVLAVSYDSPHPAEAVRVLAKMGDVFSGLINQKLGASGNSGGQITATVFDPAHLEPGRVSPRPAQNLGFAGGIGLALGLALVFLRLRLDDRTSTEHVAAGSSGAAVLGALDDRIRSEHDAAQWFGAPVLGTLPASTRANRQPLRSGVRGPVATVTSAAGGEGKTTFAAGLALDLATAGNRVICVEADFRRPKLAQHFAAGPVAQGLANILAGRTQLDDVLLELPLPAGSNGHVPGGELIRANGALHDDPRRGQLLILPSGRIDMTSVNLLTNTRVKRLVEELRRRADYVIFDTPPLLDAGDAFPFVRASDDVIVVAREGRTTRDTATAVRLSLEQLKIRGVGVVLVPG